MVLAVCVLLTPERLRPLREEQWRADLRDGPDLGISEFSLLVGALCSSSIARFHESLHRGSILLSHLTRGKNMKVALGVLGVGVVAVGGAAVGINAAQPKTDYAAVAESKTIMGYEGWWNSTPLDGSGKTLPQGTVAVNTTTGQIVDAFNRAKTTPTSQLRFQTFTSMLSRIQAGRPSLWSSSIPRQERSLKASPSMKKAGRFSRPRRLTSAASGSPSTEHVDGEPDAVLQEMLGGEIDEFLRLRRWSGRAIQLNAQRMSGGLRVRAQQALVEDEHSVVVDLLAQLFELFGGVRPWTLFDHDELVLIA